MIALSLFLWPTIAAIFAGLALSNWGIQLATRNMATQTLNISQAGVLGLTLGIGFFPEFLPVAIGFGFCLGGLFFLLGNRLACKLPSSQNSILLVLFVLSLSLTYIISVTFPRLETHLSQSLFGDIVTLSNRDASICIGLNLFISLGLAVYFRLFSRRSFEKATYGELSTQHLASSDWLFTVLALILIIGNIYFLGLLFVIGFLFLPTVVYRFHDNLSLKTHSLVCSLSAFMAVCAGVPISFLFERAPTVPIVVVSLLIICLLGFVGMRFFPWSNWPRSL